LFEGLAGRQAFAGEQVHEILEALESDHRPTLPHGTAGPQALHVLISDMLSRDPASRPSSAKNIAHQLRQVLDGLDVTDPRDILRNSGEQTALIALDDEETEPTEIFAEPQNLGIHVPPSKIVRSATRLSALVARGPVFLGMLGVAVFLGAAAYLFTGLSKLPIAGDLFPLSPSPMVVIDPSQTTTENDDGVFVLLRFPGEAKIAVDGTHMGQWESSVRLSIPPGKHVIEVHLAGRVVSRDVLLIPGTSPVFDFDSTP